jgi:hypothetical protein
MMQRPASLVRLLVAAAVMAGLSACSAIIQHEVYESDRLRYVELVESSGDGSRSSLYIEPAWTRMVATGPVFFPLIPVNGTRHERDGIRMHVVLHVSHDQDFSILAQPCLMSAEGRFCADAMDVNVVGAGIWKVDFPLSPGQLRFDRMDMLRHVQPADAASWSVQDVFVTYVFHCKDNCFQTMTLPTHDLVAIAGLKNAGQPLVLQRERHTHYAFLLGEFWE